jgi:hypothetical protein
LSLYVHRYESHEHMLMGYKTHLCDSVTAELPVWEETWKAVSEERALTNRSNRRDDWTGLLLACH